MTADHFPDDVPCPKRRLEKSTAAHKTKHGKAALIIAIAMVLLALCALYGYSQYGWTTLRQHDAHVDWLPSSATDVSLYHHSGIFGNHEVVECSLPRADFDALACAQHWSVKPRENVLVHFRHVLELPPLPWRRPPGFENSEYVGFDQVENALVHENRYRNNGGYFIVYDMDAECLYFSYSNR